MLRKTAAKLLDQAADSEDFPDRDGMDPDYRSRRRRRAFSPQPRRNVAKALDESLAVLAMA
jgi:hypothetical protein